MKILLAGGGTAGHIEPALAVARAMKRRNPSAQFLFLGTKGGLENTLIPRAGFTLTHIPKVAISRSLSPSLLKVPFQLIGSIAATIKALKGVDCAIGFGGYVSGPLYFAAAITRTPFVIHEQNAKPGWANRIGAYFTSLTAVSYPVSQGKLQSAKLTGLPLRDDVIAAFNEASLDWSRARKAAKEKIASQFGLSSHRPLVFIFGGSQGSQAINAVVADALPSLTGEYSIMHGVGAKNVLPQANDHYAPLNYVDEMATAYLAADLIISRSGAVTCAEVAALARYSLFIPLPVGNGEQALNARELVENKRAEIIQQSEFTSQWLLAHIDSLLARSAASPVAGDGSALKATDKICDLVETAGAR